MSQTCISTFAESGAAFQSHGAQLDVDRHKVICGCRVPLITTFLAAFQDSKQIYIVMEHCAGGDLLEQLLKEGRAMTEQRVALEVALPILTSLSHIHQLRIIHR